MLFPIRCHTCNKSIGARYQSYLRKVQEYRKSSKHKEELVLTSETTAKDIEGLMKDPNKQTPEFRALADLNIQRYCCRRHFLTEIDLLDICQRGR